MCADFALLLYLILSGSSFIFMITTFMILFLPLFISIEMQDQTAGKLFADEAAAIYERAINSLMKKNTLIYFAYADFEEVRH